MYAAAGGASLASRQARQRQRQQKKTQQLQAKLHPPKPPGFTIPGEHGTATPTRGTSRQFHQLPTSYLRAPQAHGRKLSSSYTGQSKLQLLPIEESDTLSVMHMRMHSHAHMHHGATAAAPAVTHSPYAHRQQQFVHQHQQQQQQLHQHQHPYTHVGHERVSPKLLHRHSGSSDTTFHQSQLPKSATATLPLVSQVEATPPTTPCAATALPAVGVRVSATVSSAEAEATKSRRLQIEAPYDSIIVTPATPIASPCHVAKQQQLQQDDLPEAAAEKQPLTSSSYDEEEAMQPLVGPLERKCSVYRMRRNDAFDHDVRGESDVSPEVMSPSLGFMAAKKQFRDLQFQHQQQQQQQYEPLILEEPTLMYKGLPSGRKWQPCAYCEEGICVCEHIECAQGRAAWLERGRRCSVQDGQAAMAAAGRRWVKRNRIQDASLGGSSDDEDLLGVLRGPSTFANAFLYVGLGTIALGLVIAFVGTGEKGFKTVELRLIGPSLIGLGLICCILRILFCICPSHCISSNSKTRKKNGNKVDADHTTSLLRGESKRVSIARGPSIQKYPIAHKRSSSKMLNEGMEALRQIATTSLFMQNEQKPASTSRVVPIINEPESATSAVDAPLEMKKLQPTLNVSEISEGEEIEEEEEEEAEARARKEYMERIVTEEEADELQRRERKTVALLNDRTISAIHTNILNYNNSNNNNNDNNNNNSRSVTIRNKPPLIHSDGKRSRQRVAFHQYQETLPDPSPPQSPASPSAPPGGATSQSLSSSSTIQDNDGNDDHHQEETSLILTNSAIATNDLMGLPTPSPHPPPTTTATNPASRTGAIPRVTSAPLAYDLPSAVPHSSSTGSSETTRMSSSRSAAFALLSPATSATTTTNRERESRVRGPLAMPLSLLTASNNRYGSKYSFLTKSSITNAATTTTTTTTTIVSTSSTAITTTTTLSLLPLPMPSTSYVSDANAKLTPATPAAAAATTTTSTTGVSCPSITKPTSIIRNQIETNLPGQIMTSDTPESTLGIINRGPSLLVPTMQSTATATASVTSTMDATIIKTNNHFQQTILTQQQQQQQQQLQQQHDYNIAKPSMPITHATSRLSSLTSSSSFFKFPKPLSTISFASSSSSGASPSPSSASSNGRPSIGIIGISPFLGPPQSQPHSPTSANTIFTTPPPPPTTTTTAPIPSLPGSVSKFEPELVLSPAKLGQ